ncbi:site-specific integrase [Chryseobacterium sp. SG20098]|uniref:tyrosine-type recombinase/integrase n=1 Tax=Chryseobacterium sp. SG20098 TaxID=3074145 RepID=UPI0028834524|nr:site-specific integrase [Chryseobacterium sp. SG20098]WNI34727.1 site-specific integrase [Chryseobacterium sp. SG20098]
MKNRWTTPKLKTYPLESGKEWYVWFRFNGGNPIRVKEGLKEIKDYQEREQYGLALAEVIADRLKKGWVPKSISKTLPQPEDLGYNIIQAFDLAFDVFNKKLAKKTCQDYTSIYRAIKPEIIKLGWQNHNIKEFETYHIKLLLEATKQTQNWSNIRYNKGSNVVRSIFSVLKKEFIVKNNPAQGLEYLEDEEPQFIDVITDKEQTEIINHFKIVCPSFNVFLKIIYQCGIRPNEIRQIKCSMIDLNKQIFILPKEITKTKARKVPFSYDLKEDLLKIDLSNSDNFLFGIQSPYCRRKNKLFIVSPYQLSVNVAGNMWRDNVHKILNIHKKMYWFKHKGANDKEGCGMSIPVIATIFGHSKEKTTEIYATKHQEKEFEIARKLMPKFN